MSFKPMRIILGGPAGSGKTSVGELLSKKLGLIFYSMGEKSRNKASLTGMKLHEYQQYLNLNPDIEKQNDFEFIQEMKQKKGFVLDYRMGFHFFNQAFCIYLDILPEKAALRVKERNGLGEQFQNLSIAEVSEILEWRNRTMRDRFMKLYGVDFTNPANYNFRINTDNRNLNEIVIALVGIIKNHNSLSYRRSGWKSQVKATGKKIPNHKRGSKTGKNYWQEMGYDCDKIKFKSLKAAFEGIIKDDEDGKTLRPYKCERCDFFHLTHKSKKTYTKKLIKKIRPCDVFYKAIKIEPNKLSFFRK